MHLIRVRNVAEALPLGLQYLARSGRPVPSRNGPTLEAPGVVMTVYDNPTERFVLDPVRNCNPFFHFIEGLWMIAGDNRVGALAHFNKRMLDYSDDGLTLNGAYGHRARFQFGVDQLDAVRMRLLNDRDTRQAVVCLWDPAKDVNAITKDRPCNDLITFRIRDRHLDMVVHCRSNDVIWGAYGANAVHFSMIQEWLAASVGVRVGTYTQVSDSYHVYTDLPLWKQYMSGEWRPYEHVVNPYDRDDVYPVQLFEDHEEALLAQQEAVGFFNILGTGAPLDATITGGYASALKSFVFSDVVRLMVLAWVNHKNGQPSAALACTDRIAAPDLRVACQEWLERRYTQGDLL